MFGSVLYPASYHFLLTPHQEEGRTALALALMEQRQDIADLILSIDQTDVKHAHATVSFHTLCPSTATVDTLHLVI